jgi:hypothetical protein
VVQLPGWWLKQADCIHRHESVNWHLKNDPYCGGMQFNLGTWHLAGGQGNCLRIAHVWWSRIGHRWGTRAGWPNTAVACHLL